MRVMQNERELFLQKIISERKYKYLTQYSNTMLFLLAFMHIKERRVAAQERPGRRTWVRTARGWRQWRTEPPDGRCCFLRRQQR